MILSGLSCVLAVSNVGPGGTILEAIVSRLFVESPVCNIVCPGDFGVTSDTSNYYGTQGTAQLMLPPGFQYNGEARVFYMSARNSSEKKKKRKRGQVVALAHNRSISHDLPTSVTTSRRTTGCYEVYGVVSITRCRGSTRAGISDVFVSEAVLRLCRHSTGDCKIASRAQARQGAAQ